MGGVLKATLASLGIRSAELYRRLKAIVEFRQIALHIFRIKRVIAAAPCYLEIALHGGHKGCLTTGPESALVALLAPR